MSAGVHGDYKALRSCNSVYKEFIGASLTGSYSVGKKSCQNEKGILSSGTKTKPLVYKRASKAATFISKCTW